MAGNKATGGRLSASLLAGLLLVPAAAFAAVVLVSPAAQGEDHLPQTTLPEANAYQTLGDLEQRITLQPVTASEDDLAKACGEDGAYLVELEEVGEITEIQQAALDALRQLCDEAGMPLAEPPAPPPIIKTVARQVDDDSSADHSDSDHDYDDHDDHDEYEHEEKEDEGDDHEREHDGSEADYRSTHTAAQAAIDEAIARGGDRGDIAEAQEKLSEAENKAAASEWDDATEKAKAARRKALESLEP